MLNVLKRLSVCLLLIGMLLIQVANPFGFLSLVSLGTWIIFFATFFGIIYVVLTKKSDNASFVYVLFIFIISLISMLLAGKISFRSMVSIFCFLEIPIFLCYIEDLDIRNLKKVIYILFIILSLFYIYLSFMPFSHNYEGDYGIIKIKELTLGYDNPNETAIFLFVDFIVLTIAFYDFKNKTMKALLFVDVVYMLYLIVLTNSRTIIILAFLYAILSIFYRNRKVGMVLLLFSLIMPLIFILVLVFFGDTVLLGEVIETGRLNIYSRVFEDMSIISFLFGRGEEGIINYHNIYVSIFSSIGIIGLVLYVSLMFSKTKQLLKNAHKGVDGLAILGTLFLIISSSTESALFIAGSAFAGSVISILLLAILIGGENVA